MTLGRWVAGTVVALVVAATLVAASGIVSAGHAPEEANFTVEPLGDRSPGATDVQYGQTVVATAGVDLETLTETVAIYEAGAWAGCSPTDASVFGIDRGDTYDGYETDEELTNNVKSFSAGEDRLETEYNGEDDLGASTYLEDGDELVSVADCIDNPDEPGWYRITGRTTGVTADGRTVTFGGESHYFWICDCEDEAAAREELGPPPSEPAATATPTATRAPDDGGATTATDRGTADDGAAATETDSGDGATVTPASTPVADGTPAGGERTEAAAVDRRTPTATAREWAGVVYRTPTVSQGDGFGVGAALAGLLGTLLLVRRRR